jgi:large subunit ribosomal protein L29
MKGSELKEFSVDELEQKARELSEELFNLRIQHATGQLENTARIGQVKKDVARVNTFLNMKVQKKEV